MGTLVAISTVTGRWAFTSDAQSMFPPSDVQLPGRGTSRGSPFQTGSTTSGRPRVAATTVRSHDPEIVNQPFTRRMRIGLPCTDAQSVSTISVIRPGRHFWFASCWAEVFGWADVMLGTERRRCRLKGCVAMDKDSGPESGVKGVVEDLKGKAKEVLGEVTGDESKEREGRAEQEKAQSQRDVAKHEAEADAARSEAAVHEAEQGAPSGLWKKTVTTSRRSGPAQTPPVWRGFVVDGATGRAGIAVSSTERVLPLDHRTESLSLLILSSATTMFLPTTSVGQNLDTSTKES